MMILSVIIWRETLRYYVCWQLAGLSADDMIAVNNMRCLCADTKKSSGGGFTLKFDVQKVKVIGSSLACMYTKFECQSLLICSYWKQKKHAHRKERTTEQSAWALSRFYPVLEVSTWNYIYVSAQPCPLWFFAWSFMYLVYALPYL